MKDKIVSTDCGLVRGKRTDAGYAFLGIPFGRAERFCPPEPVTWEGVRDCLEYGPAAPQPDRQGAWPEGVPFSWNGSEEEGLNLNIWTKSTEKDANLPVVIYIYGGAFQVGSNSMPSRAGDLFMEDREMVFVAVNYRVGVLGFLEMGEIEPSLRGSGNNGIRDLLLAIDWVRRNIRSFGGSPERIALFGISAGAKSIASLLTLPQIQECCSQVVLESGAMQAFRTEYTARAVARDFLKFLPADTSPRDLKLGELLRCQAEFCGRAGATCFFGPVLTEPFAED